MSELLIAYDGRRYRIRSLKLQDAATSLYFEARSDEPIPPEAQSRHGALFALKTEVCRWLREVPESAALTNAEEPGRPVMVPGRPIPPRSR